MATDFPRDRILAIRAQLAEDGHERTPQEVESYIETSLQKVRLILLLQGVPEEDIPESDTELVRVLSSL